MRCPRHLARHSDPQAAPRAVRLTAHPPVHPDPPLPVRYLPARVGTGHAPGGGAESHDLPRRAALGRAKDCVSAPEHGEGCRVIVSIVEHLEQRGAGRRTAGADRLSHPFRQGQRDRGG